MLSQTLLISLRFYKRFISPLLGQRCRFVPTCSEYAMQAIAHYGALKGSYFTIKRLLRCQPLCQGGWDPLPLQDTVSHSSHSPAGKKSCHHTRKP